MEPSLGFMAYEACAAMRAMKQHGMIPLAMYGWWKIYMGLVAVRVEE